MTRDEAMKEYAAIRKRSEIPFKDFTAKVRVEIQSLGWDVNNPENWVKGAKLVGHKCFKCDGTGAYRGRGPSGPCYRCSGKGYRNDADVRRNFGYDTNRVRPADVNG